MNKRPDVFIFEISKRHGIEEDTVAYMLAAWVTALSNFEAWLDTDVVEELQDDYNLDAEQIEYVSSMILDALENTHIPNLVAKRRSMVEDIDCKVSGGLAEMRVVWG